MQASGLLRISGEQAIILLFPLMLVLGIASGYYLEDLPGLPVQAVIFAVGLTASYLLLKRFLWLAVALALLLSLGTGISVTNQALNRQLSRLPQELDSGRAFRIQARVLYSWATQYGRAVKVDRIQVIRPEGVGWKMDRLTIYLPEIDGEIRRHSNLEAWVRLDRRFATKPHPWPMRELQERFLPGYSGSVKSLKLITIQTETRPSSPLSQGNQELISLFLMGNPSFLWRERLNSFGLGHLLAISGLHCLFVYLGLQILLMPLRRPVLRFILTACGLLTFAWWVGWSASVTRASLMLILWHLLPQWGRVRSWPRLWCALFVIGLVADPLLLLSRGFWYSFAASLGLILGIREAGPSALEHPWLKVIRPFLPILSAQLFVVPINLMFDNHTEFSSLFWNILGFGFLCVLLVLLLIALSALAVPSLSAMANFLEQGVADILAWLSQIPVKFELIRFPAQPWLVLLTLIFFILVLAYGRRELRWYLGMIILVIFLTVNRPLTGERLVMLDVDQGLCVLLTDQEGNAILFDAGGKLPTGTRLGHLLRLYGAQKVVGAYISHANLDHYNLLETLPPDFPLFVPAGQLAEFREIAILKNFDIEPMTGGRFFKLGSVSGQVLWPKEPGDNYPNTNEESLVILLEGSDWAYLSTGDAGQWMEARLPKVPSSKALILQAGHHGSRSATSEAFLNRIKPIHTLISCGQSNRFGHPHPLVIESLQKHRIDTRITAERGTIQIMEGGAAVLPFPE